MTDPHPATGSEPLVLRRTFEASRDRVFRAFTEPGLLERWHCPNPDARVEVLAHELRVDGAWRLAMHMPGSDEPVVVGGVFRDIAPPERLVYTWTWESGTAEVGVETPVRIHLDARGPSATVLTLTHERLPSANAHDGHERGWIACLARLESELASPSATP